MAYRISAQEDLSQIGFSLYGKIHGFKKHGKIYGERSACFITRTGIYLRGIRDSEGQGTYGIAERIPGRDVLWMVVLKGFGTLGLGTFVHLSSWTLTEDDIKSWVALGKTDGLQGACFFFSFSLLFFLSPSLSLASPLAMAFTCGLRSSWREQLVASCFLRFYVGSGMLGWDSCLRAERGYRWSFRDGSEKQYSAERPGRISISVDHDL
ncbi:hypothetical protein F5X96DRAFT_441010 [Biscogniauxia mediterranea]|nr:hypothetical protein F5X96DRAFT_441010 [Biscogniauxia mediterranea]